MATNNTAQTLPIFNKGAKVKLAPNTTVVGRLRAGDDLKTDLPDKAGDVTHTDAVGYVYTIHERETVPSSMTPGYGPGNPDPLGYCYHLKFHTNETRIVQTNTAKVKTSIAHANLRPNGSPAGSKAPRDRFTKNEFVMLTKAMPLQPMGAVSPKQYPAGQVVQIVSEATSSKDKAAGKSTPASLCKYEIVIVETHVYKDIYWKSKYPLNVNDLRAAN
ncbi:hypothetical protein D9619_006985 [Psilocybe cf. subviscida]|uniref:Uncharacterized protein n=1 Tax=Psilocybe cf. subviscida TaxID=2480587 RepID=A0A8H5B276_9AGAR|nr:hypothetical protein D9619_006985 [Psilocybe cf. subviscida]